jgi:signal transduction histidine kinase
VDLVVGAAFVAAGVVVALRGPGRALGLLTVAFGLAWSARLGLPSRIDGTGAVAAVAAAVPAGVLVHLVATLPTGRATTAPRRAAVAAGYLVMVSLTVAAPVGLQALAWAAVLGLAVADRARMGAVRRRWALPTLLGAGPAAAGMVLAQLAPVAAALLLAWPVALLLGLLRSRLDRSAVADLVAELRVGAPAPAQLRAALARALHDPSVELVEQVPVARAGRAVTPLERHGRRVGALVHDPALAAEPELLHAVAAGAAIARENERLHAEIGERLREVEASRARIVEAADAARARVGRDLQDGVQQRLAAVTRTLRLAEARLSARSDADAGPDGAQGVLDEAGRELAGAIDALRELAGGIYPVLLADAGLGPALESLAGRAPVPTVVAAAPDGRLPEAVEQAGYFVVAEVLDRAARLDGVRGVVIEAGVAAGSLRLHVAHDGVDPEPLQGPADRVGALDGELTVRCGPTVTTVVATVPLGPPN